MKRELFGNREKLLMYQIEQEHEMFKNKMLSKQKKEIYECCNEIRFIECVYEYLIYSEEIPDEYLDALLKCCEDIFGCMFKVYLDNEQTHVGTWEEVSDLINVMIEEQRDWFELKMQQC